jgi:hypothetical protein
VVTNSDYLYKESGRVHRAYKTVGMAELVNDKHSGAYMLVEI